MKILYKMEEKIRGKMAFDKEVICMKIETYFHEHYVIGFVEDGERLTAIL